MVPNYSDSLIKILDNLADQDVETKGNEIIEDVKEPSLENMDPNKRLGAWWDPVLPIETSRNFYKYMAKGKRMYGNINDPWERSSLFTGYINFPFNFYVDKNTT